MDADSSSPGHGKLEKFDFRRPVFLKEVELRHLRALHEDFVRFLGGRLSLFLRMEMALKITKLVTLRYAEFTSGLSEAAHICLFKAEPLTGIGLLDLSPSLALAIADRLLGGKGQAVTGERRLTEIEVGLIEDVVLLILEEWCSQWKAEPALRPEIIGHENDGRFLQTSPKEASLLALTMEATFGETTATVQIAVPYYTLEPLLRTLRGRRNKEGVHSLGDKPVLQWQGAFDHIAVPLRADWDGFEVSLREIVCLRVGDVIEMPESLLHQTRILLNGTPKFVGTVGLEGENVAVQIGRKLTNS